MEESNLFYDVLRNNFGPLFQEKSQGKFIFCLPPNDSTRYIIRTFGVNERKMLYFINSHFLRSSSYYKDHFVSLYGNTFLRKRNQLITRTGFTKRFNVKIQKEEEYLNEKFTPYKVWFLDRCLLEEGEEIENLAKKIFTKQGSISTLSSLAEMQERLRKINPDIFMNLMKKIVGFNKSYILMRNCESQAIKKLDQYFHMLLKQYDESLVDSLEIKLCVRSVLESGIYKKLITFFRNSSYRKVDSKMYRICSVLRKTKSPVEVGVAEKYVCDHTDAIETLVKISSYTTVIEKMKCIQKSLELITENITRIGQDRSERDVTTLDFFKVRKEEKRVVMLTSDEVIPIFSYVIICTKIPDLISNFKFIEKCQLEELKTTQYHYSFLNFNASVQFIKKLGREEKERRRNNKSTKKKTSKRLSDNIEKYF